MFAIVVLLLLSYVHRVLNKISNVYASDIERQTFTLNTIQELELDDSEFYVYVMQKSLCMAWKEDSVVIVLLNFYNFWFQNILLHTLNPVYTGPL